MSLGASNGSARPSFSAESAGTALAYRWDAARRNAVVLKLGDQCAKPDQSSSSDFLFGVWIDRPTGCWWSTSSTEAAHRLFGGAYDPCNAPCAYVLALRRCTFRRGHSSCRQSRQFWRGTVDRGTHPAQLPAHGPRACEQTQLTTFAGLSRRVACRSQFRAAIFIPPPTNGSAFVRALHPVFSGDRVATVNKSEAAAWTCSFFGRTENLLIWSGAKVRA